MTNSEKNILFLDNAIELPYIKKAKILSMFDIDKDLYADFNEIEPKLKEILTSREFSLLAKSAKQNLNQIIEGYKRDNIQTITIYSKHYPVLLTLSNTFARSSTSIRSSSLVNSHS